MLTEIYIKPEILDAQNHKNLKIRPYNDYSFSKDAYIVPISFDEALVAMKSLLVVFIQESAGEYTPAVILGNNETKNMLLDSDGTWKNEKYIPATIRSYPFGLGIANNSVEKFITVDTEADILKEPLGYNMFDDGLELSEKGKQALTFVHTVYSNIDKSKDITKHINSLGILKPATLTIVKDDKRREHYAKGFDESQKHAQIDPWKESIDSGFAKEFEPILLERMA